MVERFVTTKRPKRRFVDIIVHYGLSNQLSLYGVHLAVTDEIELIVNDHLGGNNLSTGVINACRIIFIRLT